MFLLNFLLLLLFNKCFSLIHHLNIVDDFRSIFEIETFGFMVGGSLKVTVKDFAIEEGALKHKDTNIDEYQVGFLLRKSSNENQAQTSLQQIEETGHCIFDKLEEGDIVIDLSSKANWKEFTTAHIVEAGAAGLYSLIYARCKPNDVFHKTHFKLTAEFLNPGPNYLSAGEVPLPKLYLILFVIYLVTLVMWLNVILCKKETSIYTNYIHYLMALLMVFKTLSLLSESIRYHYIALYGVSESWSIIYYIFSFLKGIMLFTVIILIGSGWSVIKSFLNSHEKNIIFVVLILQVLNNIAMVVIEETSPGSIGWLNWRDMLHIVDILCCGAIIFPLAWSIRHLQEASQVDGKAKTNLEKLKLFRSFYITVLLYIYFTRVLVYLLTATVPFYLSWLGVFFTELGTLLFFTTTGYKFQPSSNAETSGVYSRVKGGEDEDEEGGEAVEGNVVEHAGDVRRKGMRSELEMVEATI